MPIVFGPYSNHLKTPNVMLDRNQFLRDDGIKVAGLTLAAALGEYTAATGTKVMATGSPGTVQCLAKGSDDAFFLGVSIVRGSERLDPTGFDQVLEPDDEVELLLLYC